MIIFHVNYGTAYLDISFLSCKVIWLNTHCFEMNCSCLQISTFNFDFENSDKKKK